MLLLYIAVFIAQSALVACASSEHFLEDSALLLRVIQSIKHFDELKVPREDRSLGIYFIDSVLAEDSIDVIENNVKIFSAAVAAHTDTADHKAFYIFCVAGGDANVLSKYLPYASLSATFIRCPAGHDLASHIHTISLLGDTIVSKFYSVLFLTNDARGPFIDHINGRWWNQFTGIFRSNPSVALLGPLISCELAPHVQTHAFAMRSEVVLDVFAEFNPRRVAGRRNKARHLETSISTETINLGYNISSIYYHKVFNRTVFTGECVSKEGNSAQYKSNPTSWCDIDPRDAVFMKWGGPPLRLMGFYCQKTMDLILTSTIRMDKSGLVKNLVLPETVYGGRFYPLYKEFNAEQWRDRTVQLVKSSVLEMLTDEVPSKVCLLVRTSSMHGQTDMQNTGTVPTGLDHLIKSLLRQSNPNWEAYFFITDDHPFDQELQSILSKYGDVRLNYLAMDMKYRPKYTVRDAGYTATDQALRSVQKNTQCKWLSITNGDNIYGSEVFNRILNTVPMPDTKKLPDVVLSPVDSRNYADQDYTRKRIGMDRVDSWELRCGFLEAEMQRTRYGYAMTPFPTLGGLDLAGMFMDREKFVNTNVYFSAFTDPAKYSCPGCQDGYFISDMMVIHKWSLHRAPIGELSSLILHGPSPLWCIASGNVWYDHPARTACLSHKMVGHLYPDKRYDWESFYQLHGMRVCLRMSEVGYANMTSVIIY